MHKCRRLYLVLQISIWHMACWLQEQYAPVRMVCIASAQLTAILCASAMQKFLHALHDIHVAINSKDKCFVAGDKLSCAVGQRLLGLPLDLTILCLSDLSKAALCCRLELMMKGMQSD